MGDISSEEILFKDLLCFGVALVDVVFFEDDLVVFGLLVIRMDNVLVILVETVELLVYLWSHTMVSTHTLSYPLVLFGVLLV